MELPHSDSFRVLVLEPGQPGDVIQCRLETTSFLEEPQYEAISYVWGNPNSTVDIIINGSMKPITTNLHAALCNFRLQGEKRCLWVDALCINQSNIKEKNHQVQKMRNIYRGAQRTLCWLGPETCHDAAAVQCLKSIAMFYRETPSTHRSESIRSQLAVRMIDGTTVFDAVTNFLASDWFTRIWVIQEAVVSTQTLFFRGSTSLDLDELEGFQFDLECRVVGRGELDNLRRILRLRRADATSSVRDFARVLFHDARGFECSDPRDRVYALQGLPHDSGDDFPAVDYACSERQAYKKTMTHLLKTSSDPFYCLERSVSASASWIPDLTQLRTTSVFTRRGLYHASGKSSPDLSFGDVCDETLVIKGAVWARVTQVGPSPKARKSPMLRLPDEDRMESWHALDEFVRCAAPYPTGDSIENCLWRLRICDSVFGSNRRWSRAGLVFQDRYLQSTVSDVLYGLRAPTDSSVFENQHIYEREAASSTRNRPFLTENGYLGQCSPWTEVGDVVCIFAGAPAPFVLRARDDGRYTIISAAFVDGIMDGEAVEGKEVSWTQIRIA